MNREINTIGSKCSDIEITSIVVDMKNELEKIREQILNIEENEIYQYRIRKPRLR